MRFLHPIISHLTHWKGGPPRRSSYVVHHPAPRSAIAVVGDIGHPGRHLDATAAAIASLSQRSPYDALLLLGDHAYPRGAPSRLQRTVFEPFGPVLATGPELLAVLGNHDVMGGHGPEQLRLLGQAGRYWTRTLPALTLIGIDSNTPDDADQRAFLEDTLSRATTPWTVVALHHPPYSGGYQGSHRRTRATFAPVFERYGVDLVLSAHDHDYQRTVPIGGVTYVVTGGASHTRFTAHRRFTAVAYRQRHFVEVAAFDDRLVVRAVDQRTRVFDEYTMVDDRVRMRDALDRNS